MTGIVKIGTVTVRGDNEADVLAKVVRKQKQLAKARQFRKDDEGFVFDLSFIEDASQATGAVLTVYYKYSADDVGERHCSICRESKTLFYINPMMNCTQCAFSSFRTRMQDKEKGVKSAGKAALEKVQKS